MEGLLSMGSTPSSFDTGCNNALAGQSVSILEISPQRPAQCAQSSLFALYCKKYCLTIAICTKHLE